MIEVVDASAVGELTRVHAACFDKAWPPEEIARMLDNPASIAVAAREASVIGFAMAWAAAGDAEILTVAVLPEARRKGVAKALLSAVAAVAVARGAVAIHLDVAETNAAARALYRALGYREISSRPRYYATESGPVDALVLRLDLDPSSA
ncbi:MAG: GNAT family N-acetyltransferase [Hyphomonadaceae bacterium]|nr:GNAT family N-acetyltransferase [Hyphomonadaceae bacterium]